MKGGEVVEQGQVGGAAAQPRRSVSGEQSCELPPGDGTDPPGALGGAAAVAERTPGLKVEPAHRVVAQQLAAADAGIELGSEPQDLHDRPAHSQHLSQHGVAGRRALQPVKASGKDLVELVVGLPVGMAQHQLGRKRGPREPRYVAGQSEPRLGRREFLEGLKIAVVADRQHRHALRLTEYQVGETLRLSRNENYHLGAPKLEEVEFILSGGTQLLMYENDEIHIAGVSLADLDRFSDPNNELYPDLRTAPASFSVNYIGLNVNEPPLDDVKVRQALNLAIDKQEIASIVLGDLVEPADGILPPNFPGYDESVSGYEFDPVRAKQLLEESKYGGDLANIPPITITTPGSFGANVSLDMEVVLQMWERHLGITAEFQQTEFATFLKDLHKGRFQMFDIGWIADYPDPENFLDILFHSESSNNHTHYSNPEVDALLMKARVETDETARYALYNEAEQKILDDAPWVPLWFDGESKLLVKPNVHDYLLPPLIIPKLRYVYITEE